MQWKAETYSEAVVETVDIAAPDFDSEASLLSARPVVPLAKIGSRSRARWVSAWSAAILLITLGLGVLIHFGQAWLSPAQYSVSDSASPLPTSDTLANDTVPVAPSEGPLNDTPAPTEGSANDTAGPSEGSANDTVHVVPSNSSETSSERDQPSNPESKIKRAVAIAPARRVIVQRRPEEPVDGAPIQSRRERRRARREGERMRRERIDSVDGIFKIEDIFGGSRTP